MKAFINPDAKTIILIAETDEDKAYIKKQLPDDILMSVSNENLYVNLRYS